MVGKLGHIKQVRGNPGHNLPHLHIVKVLKRKLLQVGEQVRAHIRLHLCPHNMANRGPKKGGPSVYQAEKQVKNPNFQHQLHGKGRQVVNGHIGNIAYQQGQGQLTDRSQRGTEQVKKQNTCVLFKIWHKTARQPFWAFHLCCLHFNPHFSKNFQFFLKVYYTTKQALLQTKSAFLLEAANWRAAGWARGACKLKKLALRPCLPMSPAGIFFRRFSPTAPPLLPTPPPSPLG